MRLDGNTIKQMVAETLNRLLKEGMTPDNPYMDMWYKIKDALGAEKMLSDVFEFLDSSDVGRNILIIRFGIYKLVCTNGLVIGRADGILYRQKHIGVKADEFEVGGSLGS
mgnify:CR=1 FL=1